MYLPIRYRASVRAIELRGRYEFIDVLSFNCRFVCGDRFRVCIDVSKEVRREWLDKAYGYILRVISINDVIDNRHLYLYCKHGNHRYRDSLSK